MSEAKPTRPIIITTDEYGRHTRTSALSPYEAWEVVTDLLGMGYAPDQIEWED